MQYHQDLMNDFDWGGKIKQPASKILRVWTKRAWFWRKLASFYLSNGNHSSNLDDIAFYYKFQSISPQLT